MGAQDVELGLGAARLILLRELFVAHRCAASVEHVFLKRVDPLLAGPDDAAKRARLKSTLDIGKDRHVLFSDPARKLANNPGQ